MLQVGKLRTRCVNYDYRGINASEGVFGIHKFPAMLHYRLVESLVEEFSVKDSFVFDPFCGSGVTLNVSIRKGRNAIGTDINPLALLISEVRSYKNFPVDLDFYLHDLLKRWNFLEPDVPSVRNLSYWFKNYTVNDLGKLRRFIIELEDLRIKKFFCVVFSQTVRDVSLTRKNEFKRYRMKCEDIEKFNPNVLEHFITLAQDYHQRLLESEDVTGRLELFLHDVRIPMPFDNKVDLVITSPPYGDSKTTVAYGEFSSFSLEWLSGVIGFVNVNVDKVSLGGKKKIYNESDLFFSPTLKEVISLLLNINKKRAMEVWSFYKDLFKSLRNIAQSLKSGGIACFVVGNRCVKGITIPMDIIVKEMFEYLGFSHYQTRVRKILNKRMPLLNSPSNKRGSKSSTMKEEYVVIMKKNL